MEPEQPFPRFCSYCGNPLVPGAQFCKTCGQQILLPPQLIFNWRRILSVTSNRFLQPIIRVFLPLIIINLVMIYSFQLLRIILNDILLPFARLDPLSPSQPPPNLALSIVLSNTILLLEGASPLILNLLIIAMAYLVLTGAPPSLQTSFKMLTRRWRPFTIIFLILNVPLLTLINYAYLATLGYLPDIPNPFLPFFIPTPPYILPPIFAYLPFIIIGIPVLMIILIYIVLGISLYQPIILFENPSIISALKTSWHRMAGRRWSVFIATLLIALLFVIPQSLLLSPYTLTYPVLLDLLTPLFTVASSFTQTIVNTTIYYLLIPPSIKKPDPTPL